MIERLFVIFFWLIGYISVSQTFYLCHPLVKKMTDPHLIEKCIGI